MLEAFEPVLAEVVVTQAASHRRCRPTSWRRSRSRSSAPTGSRWRRGWTTRSTRRSRWPRRTGDLGGAGVLVTGSIVTVAEARSPARRELSTVRGICAAVLVFEGLVIFFATLVALDLTDVDHAALWAVGGGGAVLCVVAGRAAAAAVGATRPARCCRWPLVATGFVVPVMFFLGLLFGALWFLALHLGRKVERLQAARAAAAAAPSTGVTTDSASPTVTERTLVLIKPDAVRRGLVGEVLGRFERKGLAVVAMDLRTIDGETADRHYAEHVEQDFYPPLRAFITSGPLVAMVLEGDQAIAVVRGHQRRHRRPGGRRRDDPRRPVAVQPGEPGARLGLGRVRGPRDLDLLPDLLTDASAARRRTGTPRRRYDDRQVASRSRGPSAAADCAARSTAEATREGLPAHG